MRGMLALATTFMMAGLWSAMATTDAKAEVPKLAFEKEAGGLIEKAAARRYEDRRAAVQVAPRRGAVVVAPRREPAVVLVRPASCGEFHYWDGARCIDIRYTERHFD